MENLKDFGKGGKKQTPIKGAFVCCLESVADIETEIVS